jgi:hypothetical protein
MYAHSSTVKYTVCPGTYATTSRLNSLLMPSQKSDTNMGLIRNRYKATRICTFWSPSAGCMVDAYAG